MDYSRITCYATCPRRYRNKYILRLEKIAYEEADVPKVFGKCIHKALELRDNKADGISWFKQNFKGLEGDTLRTTENGIMVIENFVDWEKHNFPNLEVLSAEIKDSYDIEGIPFTVVIDRVVRLNGNIYVWDYKVTTSKGAYFFKKFEQSHQVSAYCNYVQRKYGQCSGFFPIQIAIQDLKKPKLFDFEHKELAKEYSNLEVKYSKYYKKDMWYASGFHTEIDYQPINRNPAQLKDFEEQVGVWAKRIDKEQDYPKNCDMCTQYKGCEYWELCMSLDDESIMRNLYNKKEEHNARQHS